MTSHIDIQVNSQSMVLPDNFSLSVTEENPLFHDVAMHSDPVSAPMEGNRHIFQNVDDPLSRIRPVDLEHLPANIIVSGIPFRSGTISIQEGEELDGQFSFNIDEATQSFDDLIGDLKCCDVPLYNNELIPIGEKVCDVNVALDLEIDIRVRFSMFAVGETEKKYDIDYPTVTGSFEPQALGFSCPGRASGKKTREYPGYTINEPIYSESFINVSEPYQSVDGKPAQGAWRYCNARVCYTHYGLDTNKALDDSKTQSDKDIVGTIGETTQEIQSVDENFGTYENYGPYWVLDANRPQSGICFYVLYFLDCLFAHLGVQFDNSALTAVEDLRRLCFFTTKCKFFTDTKDTVNPVTTLSGIDSINQWLEYRGCGGKIEFPDSDEKTFEEHGDSISGVDAATGQNITITVGGQMPGIERSEVMSFRTYATVHNIRSATAKVCTMYATSENFPEETVKSVIESLEALFGIRFRYDYQHNKVTAYLMRDVFRQRDASGKTMDPITLPCEVLKVNKLAEKVTGVRVKYSAESDGTEQKENIRRAKRDYDTDFDYIDYRQGRTKVCMPAQGETTAYTTIARDLRTENVTCYVDFATGNAYRFKISKEVDSGSVAYHRLFEVGQFHGAEYGDCSRQNEDFVKELVSDFQPMSWNDVNAYAELKRGSRQSVLAAYIDEEMEHEFVTQKINHPIYNEKIDIYATEVLRLIESYDPTGTDDGNSPLQSMDWGLAIALMRGGGSDATVQQYDRGYDGFDNSRWRIVAGGYAMASDTMDQFGNTFDYNGTIDGDGGGERFSLKIRSWKPFLYYEKDGQTIVTTDLSLEGKDVEGETDKTWIRPCNAAPGVMRRGVADVFLPEYIWFLLNRRPLRIHCRCEVAALVDIPNHWYSKFRIGDLIGFIDKYSYDIDAKTGIGEVDIDFFAI